MPEPIVLIPPEPRDLSNACGGRTEEDRRALREAAERLIHARTMAMRTTAWLARHVLTAAGGLDAIGHRVFGMTWDRVEARIQASVETVLWRVHDVATLGVGRPRRAKRRDRVADPTAAPPGLSPEVPRTVAFDHPSPEHWLNRLVASASGAISGFIGLPGLLLDIPVTTTFMLRSIAAIARDHGEDLTTDDARRACLEVLAQGGKRTEDDDAELGYWSARAGLSHLTISALIRTVASRFGVTLSGKVLAQAVPVAGALAGGGLNWVFMGYYQEMAHVHFTIRAIERRTGDPAGVRLCFDHFVAEARARRQSGVPPSRERQSGVPISRERQSGVPLSRERQSGVPLSRERQSGLPVSRERVSGKASVNAGPSAPVGAANA